MGTQILRLPIEFMGRGDMKQITFVQVKRTDNVAMYKLTYPSGLIKHEVVIPRVRPKKGFINGKIVEMEGELKESYPRSEAFGSYQNKAFAFSKLEDAERKYAIYM